MKRKEEEKREKKKKKRKRETENAIENATLAVHVPFRSVVT